MRRVWAVERHASVETFLERAGPSLLESEADNTLLLGLANGLRTGGSGEEPPYLAVALRSGEVQGAALAPRDYPVCLSRMPLSGGAAIARDLAKLSPATPGIVGPGSAARGFARTWSRKLPVRVRGERRYRLHVLQAVTRMEYPPGRMRLAGPADETLLAEWLGTFRGEAGISAMEPSRLAGRVIAGQSAFLWDDEGPVSLAVATASTPNAIRIGYVYTPRPQRNRGYATACVAALSKRALASGRKFCCLYTDASDHNVDRIYYRIGYRATSIALEYGFQPLGASRDRSSDH